MGVNMSEITENKMENTAVEKTEKEPEKKNENPKGTITLNEALAILKDKSDIEKMGLRIAAVRDGFKSPHTGVGKEKFLLNEAKFTKWIEKTILAVPEGYVMTGKAARDLYITTSYAYALIHKYKIKIKKAGAGKGKIFVDFEGLKQALSKKKKEGDRK